ncbi:hypothetical protein J5474_05720 [Sagittula sp. M10.9X]|uniref:Uncharacterized protein n=2 Tax=Sagittula salina TaxID=2820268 RepID=A0A940MHS9_9RHOB|nr:hypothetical protein [Sagittula salina]
MRDERLIETMVRTLALACAVIAARIVDCNSRRPQSALGYQTPADYARVPPRTVPVPSLCPAPRGSLPRRPHSLYERSGFHRRGQT